MSLPSEIASIKVHPAIGFARVSPNEDFYVFGDQVDEYKSSNQIKRQAVQYKLYGYDSGGNGIEELTPVRLSELGLSVVWQADVANLKIAKRPGRGDSFAIKANARSDSSDGLLFGKCGDFEEGQSIPLGKIRSDGVFIPPVAGVFRQDASVPIPDSAGLHSSTVTDNTCDGFIKAIIIDDATGDEVSVPVIDGYVVVSTPDFAPDWDDDPTVGPTFEKSLLQTLESLLGLPNTAPATPVNAAARALDQSVLRTGTGDFAPGIEINPLNASMFEPAAATGDPDEVRVKHKDGTGAGIEPGDMTFNLCSPWQYDFKACSCHFWPNHRPDVAFMDDPSGPEVNWRRKQNSSTSSSGDNISTNNEYIDHVYELGIIRKVDGKRVEKERDQDID